MSQNENDEDTTRLSALDAAFLHFETDGTPAHVGSVTFFGSWVAFGKLAEFIAVKWKLRPGQKILKYGFSIVTIAGGAAYAWYAGLAAEGVGDTERGLAAGILVSALAIGLFLPVLLEFLRTGLVARFPTLIVSVVAGLAALLAVACGLILDANARTQVEIRRLLYLNAGTAGRDPGRDFGQPALR